MRNTKIGRKGNANREKMDRKAVVGIISALLLISMLILAFNIQPTYTQPGTILSIDPSTTEVLVGDCFTIKATVTDVIDLFGFEFCLGFNTTFLEVLDVTIQPPFHRDPHPTIEIVEPDGYVRVAAILPPEGPTPSGSFLLVSITFNATASGGCLLDLYDTLLIGREGVTPIAHTIIDGEVTAFSQRPAEDESFEEFGPRVDTLLIKIYNETYRVFQGIEDGEVDIIDKRLSSPDIERWSQAPYNETITLAEYMETGMYVLDINNNETIPTYSNWRSPTSYHEFRQAIAHLVNRTRIITEILNGSGVPLTTPVMPWLEKWFNPDADLHPYDPIEAAAILDTAGFVQGSTANPHYDPSKPGSAQFIREYPPDHEKAGQDLDALIFYVRHDHPERNATGHTLRDELLSIGIPVHIPPPVSVQEIISKIWLYGDYHLYTGGWGLVLDPDYLYSLYHSRHYGPGYVYTNYNNVHDDELDYWLENLYYATNQEEAVIACREAQRRLAEIVAIVPLWAPVRVKACRSNWQGVVNEESFGVNSWWTFLNAHPEGVEQEGTIRYGFSRDIEKFNPLFSAWYTDWLVLDKIYDTLIKRDPCNVTQEIPWMAEDWTVETWEGDRTKLIFHLRENIYWHDGLKLTSEDVKFTIEYLKSFSDYPMRFLPLPTFHYSVTDVHHVDTPDPYTVVVHESVPGIWALHDIGELPILPKHIWNNVTDPLGFAPDSQLVGTGPFKFVEYVEGDHVLLESNTNYFKCCPVQANVDVESRRVDPGRDLHYNVTVGNCFADKTVNVTIHIHFDGSLVENRTLVLEPCVHAELGSFTVETLAVGFHEIRVEHSPDPYLNRTCTYTKHVWATVIEDVNLDFIVDVSDMAEAARAFGAVPGHPRWDVTADINHDYIVDISDIAQIARKFGWIR